MVNLWNFLENAYNTIKDYITNLEDIEFGGNSGLDWVLVPILFVLIVIFFYTFRFIVLRRIRNWIKKREGIYRMSTVDSITENIQNFINWPVIFVVSFYLSISHLEFYGFIDIGLRSILFFILAWVAYRLSKTIVDTAIEYQVQKNEGENVHILEFFRLVAKSTILVILSIWFLSAVGVNITTFMAGLGIAGLTIAFALQNVFADLFAAITIYLDKPFEIGDRIVINGMTGQVEKIGIRSTHIRSLEGHLVIYSNQQLTQSEVENYGKMDKRRVVQTIGIGCETPVEKMRQIPQMVKSIIQRVVNTEFDRIHLVELSDFSWNYEYVYYITSSDMGQYLQAKEEILYQILEKFEEEKIEIPYPIQELILRDSKINLDENLEVKLKNLK